MQTHSPEERHQAAGYVRLMFWVELIRVILSFLLQLFSENAGDLVNLVCGLVVLYVLFQLGRFSAQLHKAAVLQIASIGVSLVSLLLSFTESMGLLVVALLASLASLCVDVYATYHQYYGFGMLVFPVLPLANDWPRLWKWTAASLAVLAVALVMTWLSPLLAIFLALAGAIMGLVVGIWELVLLYRTAETLDLAPRG